MPSSVEITTLVGAVSTGVLGVAFLVVLLFAANTMSLRRGDLGTQQLRMLIGVALSLVALGGFSAVTVGQTWFVRTDDTEVIWGVNIAAASAVVFPTALCLALFNGLGGRLGGPLLALAGFVFEVLGNLMPNFGNFLFAIFAGISFTLAALAVFAGERFEITKRAPFVRDRAAGGGYALPFWRVGVAVSLAAAYVLWLIDVGVFDVYSGHHLIPAILWVVYVAANFVLAFLLLFLTEPTGYDPSGVFDGSSQQQSNGIAAPMVGAKNVNNGNAVVVNGHGGTTTIRRQDITDKYAPV